MPVPARINFVTLGVEHVQRAREFYTGLGWAESAQSTGAEVRETVAFFDLNGTVLALYRRDLLAADLLLDDLGAAVSPPGFRGVTVAVNVETPEEVQQVIDQAVAAGGSVLVPAKQMEWGGVAGYFADLDGHAWEVAYNPGMPLDPEGRIRLR